jgi:hypothetical protein
MKRSIFVSGACVLLPTIAGAQADYLRELPEAQRIVADVKGENEVDTVARQLAAIEVMQDVIREMNGHRGSEHTSAAENAAFMRYRAALGALSEEHDPKSERSCGNGFWDELLKEFRCRHYILVTRTVRYGHSEEFRREILESYLSPATIDRYYAMREARDGRVAAAVRDRDAAAAAQAARVNRSLEEDRGFFDAPDEPLRTAGAVAAITPFWLNPALVLFGAIAMDRDQTKTIRGWVGSQSVTLDIPTGKIIPGNPEVAALIGLFWTLVFPVGYFYFPVLRDPSVNLLLGKILVPIALVAAAFYAAARMRDEATRFWKGLLRAWICILGLAALDLIGWLIYAAGR